ncbi:hypothetical protein DFH07DRAFT_963417 [Mycena maculata]|uniref:Uncharacterized protein n=1 Tax=Mycena maculata TaxID=230809 RepID=A0AAD7N3T1_9AGAR|nr:hypothetical protein DFH07DRAFT_963417 [Mycena maculata]
MKSEFATRVKDHFIPANWKLTALADFYVLRQGSDPFPEYAKSLQRARNALSSAGSGYTISDSILKNHLLFFSHPILRLRVCGQSSFTYADLRVDTLISNMSSLWDSLIAERVVKTSSAPLALSIPTPASSSLSSTATSLPTPPSSATRAFSVSLTHAEKEALKAAGGCYHCKKTPQTLGWVKHRSYSCPGDAALGIPPRSAALVVAAVGPVGFSSAYEEGFRAVDKHAKWPSLKFTNFCVLVPLTKVEPELIYILPIKSHREVRSVG